MMTTDHPMNGYNYQEYVPTEGIFCPICDSNCNSLQNLNRVRKPSNYSLTQWY
jgi:hypothetical protein